MTILGSRLVRSLGEFDRPLEGLPALPHANRVLMVDPMYFDVEYVINPHMEGNIGKVDRFLARQQWAAVVDTYRSIGQTVDILPAPPGLPDGVFCANPCLSVPPGLLAPGPGAVASLMKSARREVEVPLITDFLRGQGAHVEHLDPWTVPCMEGTGDGCWHPGRGLLWAGVGPRSSEVGWSRVAAWTGVQVVLLQLVDPRFYHLDTCLSMLDEHTGVFYPGAFDSEGQELLRAVLPRSVEIDEDEAMRMFCNGHSPDGRHFLVQEGSPRAAAAVRDLGFEVLELSTDQFMLSGGSVFCMKLHYWAAAESTPGATS